MNIRLFVLLVESPVFDKMRNSVLFCLLAVDVMPQNLLFRLLDFQNMKEFVRRHTSDVFCH